MHATIEGDNKLIRDIGIRVCVMRNKIYNTLQVFSEMRLKLSLSLYLCTQQYLVSGRDLHGGTQSWRRDTLHGGAST